jgi:hypothetical protein
MADRLLMPLAVFSAVAGVVAAGAILWSISG